MKKINQFKTLLNNARLIFVEEGFSELVANSAERFLSPVVGKQCSKVLYYNINKVLHGKIPMKYTNSIKNINKKLVSEENNIFFGFYDHTPFCPENRRVLFNRTKTPVRPVKKSDVLVLCYYDIVTDTVHKFGETQTWNWQQGCRLQWYPGEDDLVIYNKIVNNEYGAVIQNVETGEVVRRLPVPVYDVDPHGRYGLSTNFSRLERLHFDYGYVNFADKTANQAAPESDGIYRVDLRSGHLDLLLSYDQIASLTSPPKNLHNYVMNIMISPNGERFSFLHRYHQDGSRMTNLLCADKEANEVIILQDDHEASHPIWRSNNELLTTINTKTQIGKETKLVIFDVDKNKRKELDLDNIHFDTHPSFSPVDNQVIVGDSYPDNFGERRLFVANPWMNEYDLLGKVYGPVLNGVKRDLHPRWDRQGNYICIDVPHPGNKKGMYVVEVSQMNNLGEQW